MSAPEPNAPGPPHDDRAERASDERLAGRLLDRAPGATDELVAAHADAVFEFVLMRVGRLREVAEDLTQDTLLTALDSIGRFDGRSSLRTWLCGIAKNKVRASVRARRARSFGDILVAADDDVLEALGRIEEEALPSAVLEREETRAFVGATLASLPESYRHALTERYVEGRSVPETARAEGRNVKAAESTLHRARRAFRDAWTTLVGHAREDTSEGGSTTV
ncbi:MAG: sigma-70 family RNA polymerase sigma factor [Planctomycetota bacterium]